MNLVSALEEYASNIKLSIAFGILLIFIIFLMQFSNIYVSSGSVFIEYNLLAQNPFALIAEFIAIIVALAMFSVFLTLIIFAVKNDLSATKKTYYLMEKLQKFGVKIFTFYLVFIIALAVLGTLLISAGLPLSITTLVLLAISLPFVFVPQSIVVDESGIANSILYAAEFINAHFFAYLSVLVIGAALVAGMQLIEFAFDTLFLSGRFVSLLLMLIVIVPLLEVLKTGVYVTKKFELIKA